MTEKYLRKSPFRICEFLEKKKRKKIYETLNFFAEKLKKIVELNYYIYSASWNRGKWF